MTWFKVDDGLWGHQKWRAASPAARALWATAGSWCAAYLTDGIVPRHVLPLLGARTKEANELVRSGLWEDDPTGWRFHDWQTYQPSREEIEAERAIARRRQAMNADPELRKVLKDRDGDRCRYCGRRVNWRDRKGASGGTYDHVVPLSAGGTDTPDNLVVCCRECNTAKAARTPEAAGMVLHPPPGLNLAETSPRSSRYPPDSSQNDQDTRPVPTRPDVPTSSDGLTTADDTPDDDDPAQPPLIVRQAIAILAARDLTDRQTAPGQPPIGDPAAWENTAYKRRLAVAWPLVKLAQEHPDWTAHELAAFAEPAPPAADNGASRGPRTTVYDEQQAAEKRRREEHMRALAADSAPPNPTPVPRAVRDALRQRPAPEE